ncbi:MAG: hypothetical protein CMP76_09395 [Flavobacterium sp.]|uniref:hypothetical protein n=1 Tax=Flavobacterium sp. TaxID=239 RepID=UPI000C3AE1B7|nr:hypothetical protein [Flavobacterium sp.]MBF03497.1 hypothetical protein [Flavobacterium sp.]|tara:strand:+ start:305 stop:556 length:252 start_codon:yes stop_codon:yes gene_type:complete
MKKKNLILASFAYNELHVKQLKNVYGGNVTPPPPPPSSTVSNGGTVPFKSDPDPNDPNNTSGGTGGWNGDSDTNPRTGNQQMP